MHRYVTEYGTCDPGMTLADAASDLAMSMDETSDEADRLRREIETAEAEAMRTLGEEHGRAAATWLLDGNSPQDDAENLLRGILEGDPEILDQLPNPPSGEWSGDPTAEDLISEAGLNVPEDPDAIEDLWRAFCDGFGTGVHNGAETEARTCLGIPDDADLGDCGSRLSEVLAAIRADSGEDPDAWRDEPEEDHDDTEDPAITCFECGHLHYFAREENYGTCPIDGCGCEGQPDRPAIGRHTPGEWLRPAPDTD